MGGQISMYDCEFVIKKQILVYIMNLFASDKNNIRAHEWAHGGRWVHYLVEQMCIWGGRLAGDSPPHKLVKLWDVKCVLFVRFLMVTCCPIV